MIQVFGSLLGAEELEEIRDCLERQWIGMGPKTAELESALATHLDVAGVVLLNSGSNALQMAVELLGIPPGTGAEIIVPSFTWVSCASAVMLCGHRPVFCDVDEATMNIDPASVAQLIGPRTAAILAVHYAGLPADIDALKTFGLPVIEDAAHAIDSRYGARACGTLGEMGVYSFDAVKNLAMGEGGAVVCRDPAKLQRARDLRLCGVASTGFSAARQTTRWWEHEIIAPFSKMTPPDLCAAVGLAQLRKLPACQDRRAAIWRTYQQQLADLEWLQLPQDAPAGHRHSYFTCCIRVTHGSRDALAHHLMEQDIYTTVRFHPLHLNPVFDAQQTLPASERLGEQALNLPLHPRLSDADLERIIQAVRRFTP